MSTVDRFDQSRKQAASTVADAVRGCLCDYYEVPKARAVSVERERSGEYQTQGDYCARDLLDYAGVDWLVDSQPAIVPVGERIRPNVPGRRDLSMRVDNGTTQPCETDRLPAGLRHGLAPKTMLFGWRSDDRLDRCWLLDCERLVDAMAFDRVAVEKRSSGDGTAAAYVSIADLARENIVLESWEEPATLSGGKL